MDIAPRNIFSCRPPLHQALFFKERIAPFGALGVLSLIDDSDLDLLMRRSINLGMRQKSWDAPEILGCASARPLVAFFLRAFLLEPLKRAALKLMLDQAPPKRVPRASAPVANLRLRLTHIPIR